MIADLDYKSTEPAPAWVLRAHATQINALSFSGDGLTLASGDQDGFVCVWSLVTFRPVLLWKAHAAGILTLYHWGSSLITHGRDNVIHVFDLPDTLPSISSAPATATPSLSRPSTLDPRCSLPTNAIAYCKMACLALSGEDCLVATPAALTDEMIDLCHLPSCTRVSRSIGTRAWPINDKTGTVMALELFERDREFNLLAAYEEGRVALFSCPRTADLRQPRMEEGEGWDLRWYEKGHREPVMSLAVSPDFGTAWTVSADHFVSSYNLTPTVPESEVRCTQRPTQHPGRASVAVRDDNSILAIGGWDGKIRVHSAKSFKPLAILEFHRDSVYVVAFAPTQPALASSSATDDEDDMDAGDVPHPKTWLAAAGTDQRISLWELYPVVVRS